MFVCSLTSGCVPRHRRAEEGVRAGLGFTVNLPVPAGSGDALYLSLVGDVITPLARSFGPELVLVAGFDAHRDDPLASCAVTEAGFAGMAALMSAMCDELEVPLGCVLEGGYDLGALARSVAACMEALPASDLEVSWDVHPLALEALTRLHRLH